MTIEPQSASARHQTGGLPPALSGALEAQSIPFGRLSYYRDGPATGTPLLLVHSMNAAGNAYEVKPLYDHYKAIRPVVAPDLPGFGFSERRDIIYTPRLMSDAILAVAALLKDQTGGQPIDALALSTSCEFLARAASEQPGLFRTLALVSPTGFYGKRSGDGAPGTTYGIPGVRKALSNPLWGKAVYRLLVSRASIKFFLRKTWGSPNIDEGLLDYDYISAHQPGAEYAPFSFVSGFLFSRDIMRVYKSLTGPVWMTHGTRGDFVDYKRKTEVEGRPQWTVEVFQTGALIHFEEIAAFTRGYDRFLERAV